MSEPTAERVAAIRERAERTTPGPWAAVSLAINSVTIEQARHRGEEVAEIVGDHRVTPEMGADAAFIAAAREDVPWLLARLDEQAERVRTLEGLLGAALPLAKPQCGVSCRCTPDGEDCVYEDARRALGAGEGAT